MLRDGSGGPFFEPGVDKVLHSRKPGQHGRLALVSSHPSRAAAESEAVGPVVEFGNCPLVPPDAYVAAPAFRGDGIDEDPAHPELALEESAVLHRDGSHHRATGLNDDQIVVD